jgi:hypothetical protein
MGCFVRGYWVVFSGSGGELDRRFATTEEAAADAAFEIIREAGELHAGDTIAVLEGESER